MTLFFKVQDLDIYETIEIRCFIIIRHIAGMLVPVVRRVARLYHAHESG